MSTILKRRLHAWSLCWLVVFLLSCVVPPARAQRKWGELRGQLTFDGTPPRPKPLVVHKDREAFRQFPRDETLVVHSENGGLANVVVYLLPREDQKLAVHPSYQKAANKKIELKMKDGRFEPHVLLLRTTQTMTQTNMDGVGHFARISFIKNAPG